MRILVHGLAADKLGGIETFVLNMEKFMSENLVFDYVLETAPEKNVYISGKGETHYIAPKRRMLANLKDWLHLLKKRKGIDEAVYFHMYSLAWLFPVIFAKLSGYKVIVHAHNNSLHDCGFVQRAVHDLNRGIQKCMKMVRLTNSALSAKFFFDKKPATLIYNAIDTERFSYKKEKREAMRAALALEGKHVYGFSGRIARSKNVIFLMEIFAEIAKADQEAAFLVCGDGDLMQETRDRAEALGIPVSFVGAVRNPEDYYSAMDCFVFPSKAEGLGIALIEAQCCGLTCLTSADVVPQDAKVTELLHFLPLEKGAAKWAKEAAALRSASPENREEYCSFVEKSAFNITKEAERLEALLLSV